MLKQNPIKFLSLAIALHALCGYESSTWAGESKPGTNTAKKDSSDTKVSIPETKLQEQKNRVLQKELFLLETSVDELTKKIELHPNDADLYQLRAGAYVKQGKFTEAVADANKAVSLDPQGIERYIGRADIFIILEQYNKAGVDYRTIIRLEPKKPVDYFYRGQAYEELEKYSLALSCFKRAIEEGYTSEQIYRHRGKIFQRTEKFEQAIIEYQKALLFRPTASTYLALARCYRRMSKLDDAKSAVKKGLKLEPNYRELYFESAVGNVLIDDLPAAKAAYAKWSELTPPALNSYGDWDSFLLYTESERKIDQCTKLISQSKTMIAAPILERGLLNLKLARYERAAVDMERFLNATGWAGKPGVLAASMAYLGYELCGRLKDAHNIKIQGANMLRNGEWPFPIFQFVCGSIKRAELDKRADSNSKKTQAAYFKGLDYLLHNQDGLAIAEFEWVLKNGNKNLKEYEFSSAECKRLKRRQTLTKQASGPAVRTP